MSRIWTVLLVGLCAVSLQAGLVGPTVPTATELVVAADGEVIIYFAGQSAAFDSVLNLIEPVVIGPFFHNHMTAVGAALSLGTFNAGDVLRFRMDVLSTGQEYFTGPASGNPDNVIHVAHGTWAADTDVPVNGILLGWEDVFGGGDFDYNDNSFVFTNVASKVIVPEPSMLALVGAGLALLVVARRKRRLKV
jgi:hypothetical protein